MVTYMTLSHTCGVHVVDIRYRVATAHAQYQ